MANENDSRRQLGRFLSDQPFGVLCTQANGQPYGTLVAFVASDQNRQLIFATLQNTRKYSELAANPQVAMVIDNRSNAPSDIAEAMVVTAVGQVDTGHPFDHDHPIRRAYLQKHPHMAEFANHPDCRFVAITVADYVVVNGLHDVVRFKP